MLPSNKRRSIIATEQSDSIRVICRFRPRKNSENSEELNLSGTAGFIIDEPRASVEIVDTFERKSFTFDKVSV